MNPPIVAPSVLAADFANLQRDVEMLNESPADWIHVDIMDGMFVPNISFGAPVCKALYKHAQKPLDVHLMIEKPERYLQAFKDAGATNISVHYEACSHLHRTLQEIKALNCHTGVAINPHTNVQLLENMIDEIDLVCIMSVNPGFGGQQFIEKTYQKVRQLREIITTHNAHTQIEIDGGVNLQNASLLMEAGADILVAGSFIFKSVNPQTTIEALKNINS